jgi:hypothetical protein
MPLTKRGKLIHEVIRTMLPRILLDFNIEGIVIKDLLLLLTLCAALNIRIHSSMTA